MEPGSTSDPEERIAIGEAARIAGVAKSTLRRWADQGLIAGERRPSGHRVFRRGDIENINQPINPHAPDSKAC